MRRFAVECVEERVGAFRPRNERIVAALLVEKKRRLMLRRLRGQCASQRRVVNALRTKNVEEVAVEALNLAEGSRIGPGVLTATS